MMRILFIGIGSIARRHCLNLIKLVPDIQLVFYKRNDIEHQFAKDVSAEIIDSLDLINDSLDAVFLCSPAKFRIDVYERIFRYNIPLYVEKPIASSVDDLQIINSLIEKNKYDAPSQVGFNLRYLPVINKVHNIINSKKLGNICRAVFEVGQYLPDWRKNVDYRTVYSSHEKSGGGVVLDLIHEVDLAYYFFGNFSDAVVVSNKFSHLEIDSVDTAAIILSRKTNPIATINMDYVAREKIRFFRIIGDKGTLFCDLANKKLNIEGSENYIDQSINDADYNFDTSYISAIKIFIESIKKENPLIYPIKNSLNMHNLILEAM
jgi:predicted dehydrogenase